MKKPHIRTKKLVDPARLGGTGQGLNGHWRVVKVAKEMARHECEPYLHHNEWRAAMTAGGVVSDEAARELFVELWAPELLEDAREALTNMLTQPDFVVPRSEKDEISEALILDNALRGKRTVSKRTLEERLAERLQQMGARLMAAVFH